MNFPLLARTLSQAAHWLCRRARVHWGDLEILIAPEDSQRLGAAISENRPYTTVSFAPEYLCGMRCRVSEAQPVGQLDVWDHLNHRYVTIKLDSM